MKLFWAVLGTAIIWGTQTHKKRKAHACSPRTVRTRIAALVAFIERLQYR